jgi:hypothetical protein
MVRAKPVEQYVYPVDQLLVELKDLRMSAEYHRESLGPGLNFLNTLQVQAQEIRNAMADRSNKFGDKDLPFMPLVRKTDQRLLPFKHLFGVINETHSRAWMSTRMRTN